MVRRCIVVGLLFVALGAEAQDDANESSAGSSNTGSSDTGSSDTGSSDTGSSASTDPAARTEAPSEGLAPNADASDPGVQPTVPSASDVDPAALASRASRDDRPERLELALEYAAFAFDAPSFLAAQRAALVAIYEVYCGLGNLLQNEPNTTEIVVGIGCLLGAATLTYVAYRGFARPAGPAAARARYDRFYDARREGLTFEELAATEDALAAAARADRRRRIVGGVFGALNFVAAAVLFGLVARDQLDSRVGTSVGIGTTVVGVLGVTALAVRGPSERALALYRR